MKKLIMGLGLSAIVGFSAAASAGQCTKAKLQGRYVLTHSFDDSIDKTEYVGAMTIKLNKNGTGKVTAAAAAYNGMAGGDYVSWPARWNVNADCAGALEYTTPDGKVTGWFFVSGNPQQPIMDGVTIDSFNETGKLQMKKIRF